MKQIICLYQLIVFNLITMNFVYCQVDVRLLIKPENPPKHVLSNKFFSVALDTTVVKDHFEGFDMNNNRLLNMVKELWPSYIRIGGKMADRLHFSENTNNTTNSSYIDFISVSDACSYEDLENCYHDFPNFTMSAQEWMEINDFAIAAGVNILFDLNSLIRNDDGSWNAENAKELISFSSKKGFNIDWQLGNEPNSFKHVFDYKVTATQLAKDFTTLRNILNQFPQYQNALLVGPDVTRPIPEHPASAKYLKEFLENIDNVDTLDAVTFHQYYLNGRTATITDFLNPEIFDLLKEQIKTVQEITRNSKLKNKPIWLTETSSAYGGGAPGFSNTFVGSFLWLDKLGLAAKLGIQAVVRQSLFRNSYALIDDNYDPKPDWWLSILYTRLIGKEVIEYQYFGPETVRLYCHCASLYLTDVPTVAVFGINIGNSTAYIEVEGIVKTEGEYNEYILSAEDLSLTSKNVLLNGILLTLEEDGSLPEFQKKNIDINKPLEMAPYSLAFWTLPAANAKSCFRPRVSLV